MASPEIDQNTSARSAPSGSAPAGACVVTINGGSSSIKFAAFSPGDPPQLHLVGKVDRIGGGGTSLQAQDAHGKPIDQRSLDAADPLHAAEHLIGWLRERLAEQNVVGIGHRVVHGGLRLLDHQRVTPALLEELRRSAPLDLAHLPREIALIEAFGKSFPKAEQVVCFDTAFFRDLPRVAQLLPIPRRYLDAGIRRFGFHGISYTYLIETLRTKAGEAVANGRVILAHLGAGASMAALRGGNPIDTSMAFTPLAGLVMGTRPGDLDPGLLVYLMKQDGLSAEQADDLLSKECGLAGVSQAGSDMRDLVARSPTDPRAAEAVNLFCYQAKKFIGAYAAALGGLDALVFAGGIGEHGPEVRQAICSGLEFLGLRLDILRNQGNAPVISADGSAVAVHVIPTDEEIVIARTTCRILSIG